MRIAVFFDVDNTLTKDFIQKQYAEELKCVPAYQNVEDKFGKDTDSDAFADEIIKLFHENGLTEARAKEVFPKVKLQNWTAELLRRKDIDIYLVSSGPNYYVDLLAAEYGIPKQNVKCSQYRFRDKSPYTIVSCDPVNKYTKARFVQENKGKYDIAIGVGDSEENDGLFLSQVTIPLLWAKDVNYISFSDFQLVKLVIDSLVDVSRPNVPDEELVDLVKAKCQQNPKLVQDLQTIYPIAPIDSDALLALVEDRCEQDPSLAQRLRPQKTNPVLPAAFMTLALLIVALPALSFAHHLSAAVPAIIALLSLVAGGLLLISYWKPTGRNSAFWWVASICYLVEMGLVMPIFRDVFYDDTHRWVSHDFFWGLIAAVLALLATPAFADPAKKLMDKVARTGAR